MLAAGVAAFGATPRGGGAQSRLLDTRLAEVGITFERWSFGGDGVLEQVVGDNSVRITSASQLSLPVVAVVPWGERWTFDAYMAHARGVVQLRSDDADQPKRVRLSGITDVKVRAVGRFVGDAVLLTVGANIPTGKTLLDQNELRALRVLAAPALAMRTPALGSGPGGTAGVVVARPVGPWSAAAGLSYEVRGSYSPLTALAAGIGSTSWNPGDALHLSLGADRLLGAHDLSLNVTTDFFSRDRGRIELGGDERAEFAFRLGPVVTGQAQLRVGTSRFRELTLFLVDRYRARYRDGGGTAVAGSSGNELELGASGIAARGRGLGVLLGADARFNSGLSVDNTLATAAVRAGGLTLGVVRDLGGLSVRPALRAQLATVNTGDSREGATSVAVTVTAGRRF